jgi:5'-3' exonuclease
MNPIMVLDCNYLCHKAKHTTGAMHYKGQSTGVIYGFLGQLFLLARTLRPSEIIFVWDDLESIRKVRYSFYKEKRKEHEIIEQDIEDYKQFNELKHNILKKIGFRNIFNQKGYEADDIMAKIAHDWECEQIIVTADDDILQLISDRVSLYNIKDKEIRDIAWLNAHKGITPAQWVQVKQIAGCNSDNVPGIMGVGEKTAIKYLRGELKETSKKYKDILNGTDIINRNEWLVKLPLPGCNTPTLQQDMFSVEGLRSVFKQFGFKKWLAQSIDEDWEIYFGKEKNKCSVGKGKRKKIATMGL